MDHEKRQLRLELRQRTKTCQASSQRAIDSLKTYLVERPALQSIAAFSPLKGEVDLLPLLDRVDRTWAFPRVKGEEITFYHVTDPNLDLVAGAYGILEPRDGLRECPVEKIDLFLCPGLGFDLRGGRIGRGMGFYDRELSRARADAVKLGVCFGFQLVDEVQMEDHDVRMDGIILG